MLILLAVTKMRVKWTDRQLVSKLVRTIELCTGNVRMSWKAVSAIVTTQAFQLSENTDKPFPNTLKFT